MDFDPSSAQIDHGKGEEDIARGAERITLVQAGGGAAMLDVQVTRVFLAEAHSPLSQMNEDWGAVCEAFRQRVDTFARIPGVALQPGDEVRLRYPGQASDLVLRVLEMENGRARVAVETAR